MKRSRSIVGAAVVGAVVLVVAVAALTRKSTSPGALKPDDVQVTVLGRRVYAAHCAACHGAKLEGQPNWRARGSDGRLPAPPHDASGHTWHHPDEVLFRITKLGVAKAANLKNYESAMPVYEGTLSDEEIVAALSWIKSQWPPAAEAAWDEHSQPAVDRLALRWRT